VPKWETYKDCSLVGKSPSFPTQPLPPTLPTTPILLCPLMTLHLVWTTSSACFMENPPPSLLLITRLRPALQLLVPRVVRLPDLLVLLASLVSRSPPPSPSTSTDTSSAGEITFSLTVRADLGGHLKYSQRWSGVRAGVLLGAQGAVCRGESRGGL